MICCCKSLEVSTTLLNTILKDSRNAYDGVVQMYDVDGNQGYLIGLFSNDFKNTLNISFAKSTRRNEIVMYTRDVFGKKITQHYFETIVDATNHFYELVENFNNGLISSFEERYLKIAS